jgi:flagellar basal-body rod protein FlgC
MTLQDSLNIGSMGLTSQVERIQVHAQNIANIYTPNYVRQIPVLTENAYLPFDQLMTNMHNGGALYGMNQSTPEGVKMLGTVSDPTPGKKMYMPYHPEADENGFVTLSNTNVLADMSDSMVASRMYEANLSMVTMLRTMANKALSIGQGR